MGRTYDRTHISLTWGGRIGQNGTREVWQNGVKLARGWIGAAGDPQQDLDNCNDGDLAVLYESVLSQVHGAQGWYAGAGAVLTWVKAALVDTTGTYQGAPAVLDSGTGTPGYFSLDGPASPQDSVCVTLWSGSTLGRSNYGRLYIPWSYAPVSQDSGQIAPGAVSAILSQAQTLIGGINTWADATWSAANGHVGPFTNQPVVSIMHSQPFEQGGSPDDVPWADPATVQAWTKKVIRVRVGSVKDTQRRRRNRLHETYAVAGVL